jgi:hypothetical protein
VFSTWSVSGLPLREAILQCTSTCAMRSLLRGLPYYPRTLNAAYIIGAGPSICRPMRQQFFELCADRKLGL